MKKIIAFVLALSPVAAFAQAPLVDINSVTGKATNLGNTFVSILISFAVIWIIFNVVRYLIVGSGGEDARKKARDSILYGILGLFVILSIWGLVAILRNSFRTQDNIPQNDINNLRINPPPIVQ